MPGRNDPVRIAAAQMSGIAMAHVQMRRITLDEALAEIAVILAEVPKNRRQEALNESASAFARPDESDVFHAGVTAVLERAGADLSEARRLKDKRGGGWLEHPPNHG